MPLSVVPSLTELVIPAGLLDTSETGIMHFQPLYAAGDPARLVDFKMLRLNPAAQRLLGLPEFPTGSFLTLRPGDTAAFQFYRFTYLAGEADSQNLSTLPGWQALAQRQGPQLVVSLMPTARPSQDAARRAAADGALARAQQANQQLTQEREALRRVLAHTPAAICLLRGPEYRFEYVNPAFAQLFGGRPLEGLPAAEVLPEVLNQGFIALLDRVYDTGETFLEAEVPLASPQPGSQQHPQYFNFTYQAHLEDGHADRLSVFAYNATEQVLARQQIQHLREELQAASAALAAAPQRLENPDKHVLTPPADRPAVEPPHLLHLILEQLPAAVAAFVGPGHRFAFFNDGYQVLASGRARLGHPVADLFPELVAQGFTAILDEIYATGQPYWGERQPARLYALVSGQLAPEPKYIDFLYQPLKSAQGQTQGILAFIVDVTEQVLAQQQAEALRAEAQAATYRQAQEGTALQELLAHTSAAIALVRGPAHQFTYVNPAFERLFPGRALLGKAAAEALPEAITHNLVALLDHVHQTGETRVVPAMPLTVAQFGNQLATVLYLAITCQAYRENGQSAGVSLLAVEVSGPPHLHGS
ncbi:PAS domain-containing protein [Hymenobacter sp. BRD128]|uniref:PAS domain-containing protein n=1 Tax=Hymenobacter sp. BRD128 TaxID=2675878 RepID=UPI001565A34D|nr:PAS domain-containing protein [Hymenobacter sp. BRD128]QKG57117.1 PAS domain-containing protein [Hymenobacter sp. BRD128]